MFEGGAFACRAEIGRIPSRRICPLVQGSIPFKIRNKVVLPAPEGPITETNSPCETAKVTSASAIV